MTRTLIKVGLGLLMLAVLLIGLSYTMFRAQGTTRASNPEGRTVGSETRALGADIDAVHLSGPIDLTLGQGALPSLVVRGEQRLLDNVATSQEGGALHIGIKGMLLHTRQPLQVILVLPRLDTLSVHGSGESSVNGFFGERIDVQLHGSGKLKFNGRYKEINAGVHGSGAMELNGGSSDKVEVALRGSGGMTVVGASQEFKVEQSGSGNLDAEHLSAQDVTHELNGSGVAGINALRSANITLNGSGLVTVLGNPAERHVTRTGSGEVDFLSSNQASASSPATRPLAKQAVSR